MRRLLVLTALLAGCGGGADAPTVDDADLDGVPSSRDCDDHDPFVQTRRELFADGDRDGHGAGQAQPVCTGTSFIPPGFAATGDDCDDHDRDRFATIELAEDDDLDGVGSGELVPVCTDDGIEPGFAAVTGDCAEGNGSAWQLLPYAHRDADGDGFTTPAAGTVCSGASLPEGYQSQAGPLDCDDAEPLLTAPLGYFVDADGDGHGVPPAVLSCTLTPPDGHATSDDDCAADDPAAFRIHWFVYRDSDGDGVTVQPSTSVCAGDALPAGYLAAPHGDDCDDADATRHTAVVAYADADGDGVGAGASQLQCTDGQPLPGSVLTGNDCTADDPTAWQLRDGFRDADGDGFTLAESEPLCIGAALPADYREARNGNDCDDADASKRRFAAYYLDGDGDGVGAGDREVLCLGAGEPGVPYVVRGDDVDDENAGRLEDPDDELLVMTVL